MSFVPASEPPTMSNLGAFEARGLCRSFGAPQHAAVAAVAMVLVRQGFLRVRGEARIPPHIETASEFDPKSTLILSRCTTFVT